MLRIVKHNEYLNFISRQNKFMATPLAIGAFYRRILGAGVVYLNLMTCMDSLAVACEQRTAQQVRSVTSSIQRCKTTPSD